MEFNSSSKTYPAVCLSCARVLHLPLLLSTTIGASYGCTFTIIVMPYLVHCFDGMQFDLFANCNMTWSINY